MRNLHFKCFVTKWSFKIDLILSFMLLLRCVMFLKWTDTVCFAQTSPGYNHRDLLLRLLLIPWLGHFTSCHSHRTHGFRDIPTPRVEGDRPSKMYLVTHYSILHYSILHRISFLLAALFIISHLVCRLSTCQLCHLKR